MNSFYKFSLALLFGSLFSFTASAKELFPTSPMLDKKVRFWELVFGTYSSNQLIIHDKDSPDLVYSVIDSCKEKNIIAKDEVQAFDPILADFKALGEEATALSPRHKKIWKLYAKDSAGKSRLLAGRINLRSQRGLSDTFHDAALRAQLYIPRMEKIFKEHGLPTELTRIPFVESMFQLNARSKVGATGVWQLMSYSAKPHMVVNNRRDERKNAIKSTHAAAKILKANHKYLKNWPLAITAYNHGANGVKRGVDKLGSSNLGDLILSYRSKNFGFASQNYYAEFLAAQSSYDKWRNKQLASATR